MLCFLLFIAYLVFAFPDVLEDPQGAYLGFSDDTLTHAKEISDTRGYVFLMFFNLGYLDFVRSWMCNTRLVDPGVITQTVFVALQTKYPLHNFMSSIQACWCVHSIGA